MKKDWSIDLEHGEYENNVELIIQDGIDAIEKTEVGCFVNLVTPGGLGDPTEYLSEVLTLHFKDHIHFRMIDQCGCGGYVLRVWKDA
ncbi:CGCGG family rSAM-modified RiPP protein [Ammoniphilus resinae]|uniref:CGCGG family rSAM target protein n=1 Tax=Ammoniphilus resinae TaxID=861532 RepID=A0ABS4GMB8_9BACL|nr:CGCGG family rSAM-modified RiPP protein [Ammoniphilus resinae]MBP1931399.1 putative CGCGG family rSAM target protein [Ammoniphilus resinae]